MKIVVSGWPGCGGTTLALLLATVYKLRLVRGSETFRMILKAMNYTDTGEGILKAESVIQPHYGPLYDKFISDLFKESKENIIADSDIAGFFIPDQDNLFKIFLKGDDESRRKHFITDGREEDIEFQKQRDSDLREAYKKFGADIFDLEQIHENYNIVFDNSNTLIGEQVFQITTKILPILTEEQATTIERDYWARGKAALIKDLEENNLLMKGDEILKAIAAKYKDEIEQFPEDLKVAIQNLVLA